MERIVEYLTRKKAQERMEYHLNDFDPSQLKTNTYNTTVDDDRRKVIEFEQRNKEKKHMLDRRQNYARYVK